MQTTSYISTPVPEKVSLAEESWRVFSPFVCRYQWALDDPSHSPRGSEIAHAILNRGKPGACTFLRPEGYRYILPVLHPRHFKDAIANRRKIFYVSFGSTVLLYFDIDLHYAWQTLGDGQEAKQKIDGLLRKFFGESVLFWSPSSRGFNGFLKVNLNGMNYALANELFDRLEATLQLFLASSENLADFEIKGKIGFMQNGQYQWAQYGKLPIHHPDWNFAKLEEFKATPAVSIQRLATFCRMIEAKVPHEVLVKHQAHKISLGDKPIFEGNWFLVTPAINKPMTEKHGEGWRNLFSMLKGDEEETWLHKNYYRPGRTPLTEKELRNAGPCVAQADLPRNHQRPTSSPKVRDTLQGQLEAIFDRIDADGTKEEAAFKDVLAGLFDRMESGDDESPHISTVSNLRKEQHDARHNPQSDCIAKLHRGTGRSGSNGQGEGGPRVADEGEEHQRHDQRDLHAAGRVAHQRGPINLDFSDLMAQPDSFKRQTNALLRYARYLKRVPSQEEAMQLIHDHNLFTGCWEDNLGRRRIRVRDILAFFGETFDANKCANGSVNVGKYDEWAKKKFPHGLIGGHRRYMDEEGNIVDVCQNIHVSTSFIAVFMAVVEFALITDKNQDDSVPHDRCKELWNSLKAKGLIAVSFNDRKWAVCREELGKLGIIAIPDRDYCTGKAMKWETGTFFPGLGLWKSKKQPSLLGPCSLQGKTERTTEQHNTFLQSQVVENAVLTGLSRSRPPP
jgi:hypothetical protein